MSNLQPLKWVDNVATAAGRSYTIHQTASGDYYTRIYNMMTQSSSDSAMYDTLEDVKHFAEFEHYIPKTTAEFLNPDSIADIRNWFKAAKPEPTNTDVIAQVACHLEEVDEFIDSMDIHSDPEHLEEVRRNCKEIRNKGHSDKSIENSDHLEMLDALCDQIVTATGVAYMMGFDIEGALKEVIRSNNSKMVDGKFEFDDNGKIAKPDSYSEPDLTPFISTMQILHKGE